MGDEATHDAAGILVFQAGTEAFVVPIWTGEPYVVVPLAAPDLFSLVEPRLPPPDRATAGGWLVLAQNVARAGIKLDAAGYPSEAYHHYRLAFFVALHLGAWRDLLTISYQIQQLREWIRGLTERASVPIESVLCCRANLDMAAFKDELLTTIDRLRGDAEALLPRCRAIDQQPPGSDQAGPFAFRIVLRRLASHGGTRMERRQILEGICTDAHADPGLRLSAILEELADTQSAEIRKFEVQNASLEADYSAFERIWSLYLHHRSALPASVMEPQLLSAARVGFEHFDHLRFLVTSDGGPIAHWGSFAISKHLQRLGRDYLVLLAARHEELRALHVCERLKARALGDLMSRNHFVPRARIPAPFLHPLVQQTGNVQSTEPAGTAEIKAAAACFGGTLLFFTWLDPGYVLVVVTPQGRVSLQTLEDPGEKLHPLFKRLPYHTTSDDWLLSRGSVRQLSAEAQDDSGAGDPQPLLQALRELYTLLFPAEVEALLPAEDGKVVVLADGPLAYIPFCALRDRCERHLVERYELLYWPSVTLWLATESDLAGRHALVAGAHGDFYRGGNLCITEREVFLGAEPDLASVYASAAVVIGDPDLTASIDAGSQLERLPHARREAIEVGRLLGVPAFLDFEATASHLMASAESVAIAHVAAHGVADAREPKHSFLALADGRLSALDLYLSGFGIGKPRALHAGLVVLSACQTGLGTFHPDSVIGLENGFLAAGSHAVVSTLWRIPDAATCQLMVAFYQRLLEDQQNPASVSASLRQAQLELLRQGPTAAPASWAAFRITGNTRNPLSEMGRAFPPHPTRPLAHEGPDPPSRALHGPPAPQTS